MRWLMGLLGLTIMLAGVGSGWVSAQEQVTHTVVRGDNLYRIALQYGTSVDELIQANQIANPSRLFAGTVLVIPGLTQPADSSNNTVNPLVSTTPVTHVVARGESLNIIARQYNVDINDLLRGNNIANANMIYPGQTLNIWTNDLSVTPETAAVVADSAPVEVAPAPVVSNISHIVRPGEYLSQIARDYDVSWTSLAEYNGISNPNNIYAGLELRIPSDGTLAAQSVDMGIVETTPPGARIGVGREVVVVLSTQMTYAYEDGILQHSVLVSTGLPATPTVQGDYAIYQKYDAQVMSGPGYYLPNVQWVMYFYQGYAFHGTYWHSNWGSPMSHGCVNMPNEEALWLYQWASVGTPVHVRWA